MVSRLYVEKKSAYDSGTRKIAGDIFELLKIKPSVFRRVLRYDIEGMDAKYFDLAKNSIFSEPTVDNVYEMLSCKERTLIVEYLPGQFDQRADSAAQCVQLLTAGTRPLIRCATVYIVGGVNDEEFSKIEKYLINPVDSRRGSDSVPETLRQVNIVPDVMRVEVPFISYSKDELKKFYSNFGFAMNFDDISFVQDYFVKVGREPTLTELKVIDTYWSDHCRHTTFLTKIKSVQILSDDINIKRAYEKYKKAFEENYAGRDDKYPCLMNIATIAVKVLRKEGYLTALDESEEINACSVNVTVDNDGKDEEWLIMFKNETHNHPTEIEPFGGAATCLGGAIRDPLSGRSYVYQAMRITGAGNPLEKIGDTLKGKLPQRMLTKTALAGFSSYGNQIGLATGIVHEVYHDRFKAKRLETGYVIAGTPKENVIRKVPKKGDIVILTGGDTGRDGCGGATGSSKAHTLASVETCGAEVQKGNAPEERKLQRLFRNKEAAQLILRCNDFGAGGVCVAIGELAEGLDINLDRVPKKYDGLTATELAISESQERMAVVVDAKDADKFIKLAASENLMAVKVAEITDIKRLRMFYGKETIVDIERSFLDTNGVCAEQDVTIEQKKSSFFNEKAERFNVLTELSKLNNCSQKGAGEVFDSTIGAASVLMPFGGKHQLTPAQIMAAKPPVSGNTSTVTCSSYGLYTDLMIDSPYLGAVYSIVGAVSKLVASGVKYSTIYLSLQEFFKRLNKDEKRWGEPLQALLGAFDAQTELKIGAIGGKDSMSGTFENIDVPPTVIAFGMGIAKEEKIVHNAFGTKGYVYLLPIIKDAFGRPDFSVLLNTYSFVENLIASGKATHSAVTESSVAVTLCRSILGNASGIRVSSDVSESVFYGNAIGDIIVVTKEKLLEGNSIFIGELNDSGDLVYKNLILKNAEMKAAFTNTLESVFSTTAKAEGKVKTSNFITDMAFKGTTKIAVPRVVIPVFPGTNCEYDTAKAFERAGAKAEILVVKNRTAADITETIEIMAKAVKNAQIIAFPGGFSGGDEPDGSGKFIATAFRNPLLKEAVEELLYKRDGLVLGICNGFQALIKLGLLPFGRIITQDSDSATLTFNNIARHVSTISKIRVGSNNSPWMHGIRVGSEFCVPISHGEGKLIAPDETLEIMLKNGQIATQYIDDNGRVTIDSPYNPNASLWGIEGIFSPDGRIFGKMGHTERYQKGLYQNIEGNFDMKIFENGVRYFE